MNTDRLIEANIHLVDENKYLKNENLKMINKIKKVVDKIDLIVDVKGEVEITDIKSIKNILQGDDLYED